MKTLFNTQQQFMPEELEAWALEDFGDLPLPRQEVSEYLLWAGNFKQAYEAPHEQASDEIRAIKLAMDQN